MNPEPDLTNKHLARIAEILAVQHETVTTALMHLIDQQRDIITRLDALAKTTTPETHE